MFSLYSFPGSEVPISKDFQVEKFNFFSQMYDPPRGGIFDTKFMVLTQSLPNGKIRSKIFFSLIRFKSFLKHLNRPPEPIKGVGIVHRV